MANKTEIRTIDTGSYVNEVDRIYSDDKSARGFAKSYLEYVSSVIQKISINEIEKFIELILLARDNGSTVYFIGNGGSAATASHFANDLAIGTRSYKKPFRIMSLCDNNAVMTAIANDDGYEKVFSLQLDVLLKQGDLVVAISASGNSPNLLHAIDTAKQKGAITIGLTAFDGGKLREVADHSVHVPTEKSEYGPAEDGHMVLDHLIGNYLMRHIKEAHA